LTAPPQPNAPFDGKAPVVVAPGGAAHRKLQDGFAEFRRVFPPFVCFPQIIPTDEVVSLKIFHREDEPLCRLFLNDDQKRRLDRLWEEHRFISQWPITENINLPQFIEYVTQDQPKSLVEYFETLREPFRQRAETFKRELEAAAPAQLDQLVALAERAYRRTFAESEKSALRELYAGLRKKEIPHD